MEEKLGYDVETVLFFTNIKDGRNDEVITG